MIQRRPQHMSLPRATAAAVLLVAAWGLGGCAAIGDSPASLAFVDPARYDLYDCKRLKDQRQGLATEAAKLSGLIEKAKTGVAGAVVAEAAYGNEYIFVRAQLRLAEQAWVRNKCEAALAAPPPADAAGAPPRSGSAVY